jgi:hypothetical protein
MKILDDLTLFKDKEKVLCSCDYCNNNFLKTKHDVVSKINKGGKTLFCSTACSNKYLYKLFGFSDERKLKISNTRKNKIITEFKYTYTCAKCGTIIKTNIKCRKNRKPKCGRCKRITNQIDIKKIDSLYELSNRTICKIIKKGKIKCVNCGWDKTTLDLHHIYGRNIENPNSHNNLVCLCPNCHRLAHENKLSKSFLCENSLNKTFTNWKEYFKKIE